LQRIEQAYATHIVRQRLEGIAAAAAADFQSLDVHLITVPMLRLDRREHQQALAATVGQLQPKLLVLDPFGGERELTDRGHVDRDQVSLEMCAE
jgi:hypothetical protein